MNAKELRQKSGAELQKELLDLRREQFNLRMGRATGQAAKPDQFTKVRRSIARLKTVLGEQRRGGVPAAVAVQSEAKAPAKAKAAPKAKSVKRKTPSKVKSA